MTGRCVQVRHIQSIQFTHPDTVRASGPFFIFSSTIVSFTVFHTHTHTLTHSDTHTHTHTHTLNCEICPLWSDCMYMFVCISMPVCVCVRVCIYSYAVCVCVCVCVCEIGRAHVCTPVTRESRMP